MAKDYGLEFGGDFFHFHHEGHDDRIMQNTNYNSSVLPLDPTSIQDSDIRLLMPETPTIFGTVLGQAPSLSFSFATATTFNVDTNYGEYSNLEYGEWYDYSDQLISFTPDEQNLIRKSLSDWANASGISFNEITEDGTNYGTLRFFKQDFDALEAALGSDTVYATAAGFAYGPYGDVLEGDIFLDKDQLGLDYYGYTLISHEIGHALGLSHSFDGLVADNSVKNNMSVMTYDQGTGTYLGDPGGQLSSMPMYLDIKAMEYLYGGSQTANLGDDTYVADPNHYFRLSVIDDGGLDTIDFSAIANSVFIDLRPGAWSSTFGNEDLTIDDATKYQNGEIYIDVDADIENAIGSNSADLIFDNDLNNHIEAGAGNDEIYSYSGDDYIDGGDGYDYVFTAWLSPDEITSATLVDDTYAFSDGNRTLSIKEIEKVFFNSGNQEVVTHELYLSKNMSDYNIISGTGGNDELSGTTGDDYFFAYAGDDIVHGSLGNDIIDFGKGDDRIDYRDSGLQSVIVNLSTEIANGVDRGQTQKIHQDGMVSEDQFLTEPTAVFLTDGDDHFYGSDGEAAPWYFVNPGKGSDNLTDFGHVHYDVYISDPTVTDMAAYQVSGNAWVIGQSATDNILFEISFDANGSLIIDGSGGIDPSQGRDVLSSDAAFRMLSFDIDASNGFGKEIGFDVDFTSQSIWEATNYLYFEGTASDDNHDARSILDDAGFGTALGHLEFEYSGLAGNDVFDGSTASVGSYAIYGGEGNDTLTVGDSEHTSRVEGGSGNDIIYVGNESRAWILPGEGQDTIYGTWDNDSATNEKSDHYQHNLSYEDFQNSGVSVDIGAEGTGTALGLFSNGTDTSTTNDTFELISGYKGTKYADIFDAADYTGDNYIWFQDTPGYDTYIGGDGGWEHLTYGINLNDPDFVDSLFNGNPQGIRANFSGQTQDIGFDLLHGTVLDVYANIDTVSNINFLAGTDLQDIVWASDELTHFATAGGNDFLYGYDGWEYFAPGAGNDTLEMGIGGTASYERWQTLEVDIETFGYVEDSNGAFVFSDSSGEVGRAYFNAYAGGGHVLVVEGFTEQSDQDLIFGGEELLLEFEDIKSNNDTIKYKFHLDWSNLNMSEQQDTGRHVLIDLDDNDNDVLLTDLLPADVDPNDYQNYDEIEVRGLGGNDTIDATGIKIKQRIDAGFGDDTVYAVSAPDYNDTDQTQVADGPGNDAVYGIATGSGIGIDVNVGSGDDYYRGTGDPEASGGERLIFDDWGNDVGPQTQGAIVTFSDENSGSIVDPWGGNDTFDNFIRVTGSEMADTFTGHDGRQKLDGRAGDDVISGAGGDDDLIGGDGNDTINGGDGHDYITPGSGSDVATGGDGHDTVSYRLFDGVGDTYLADHPDLTVTLVWDAGRNSYLIMVDGQHEVGQIWFNPDQLEDGTVPNNAGKMQVEINNNAASSAIQNKGSGPDVLTGFERLQLAWEDDNGNRDKVEFRIDEGNKTIAPEQIVISGTSGDDSISVKQELINMGFDPSDQDLDITIEDQGGNDNYDLSDVRGYIEIFDGEGDDDYYTYGGNDHTISVENFAEAGTNTFDLSDRGRIDVEWDLWEDNLQAADFSVDGTPYLEYFPTEANPLTGEINLGDSTTPNFASAWDVYFNTDGHLVMKSYDYTDQGVQFVAATDIFKSMRDHDVVDYDLNGAGDYGKLKANVDFDTKSIQYVVSYEGATNHFDGTDGADFFFDTWLDEEFDLLGGDDYVQLWEGGNDEVWLGDGDDEIWPDGWYFQHNDGNGDNITYDIIHGEGGYDTIHIDTWGGTPREGEFVVSVIDGTTDGSASVTYQVKSNDPYEAEQDWILVLNEDGSGDVYYNYYDDPFNTANSFGTKFLSFDGIERVEFNNTHETLDRGIDNARWAGFDLDGTGNGVHIAVPDVDYIVVGGTSGDDSIYVHQTLKDMGYDPFDDNLEIMIIDQDGDDSYDLSNIHGHIEIYDGDGNDEYFTNGDNRHNIYLKETGGGHNRYDLPDSGRIQFDLDLWEMDRDASQIVVNKSPLDHHHITTSDPAKFVLHNSDGTEWLFGEMYFDNDELILKSYEYDESGNQFVSIEEIDALQGGKNFEVYLNGSNDWGKIEGRIDFENQSIQYLKSIVGVTNTIDGTSGDDFFFDGKYDDVFNLGDGNDHVQLWNGGNDTIDLGAGDDVIWPDGWYYQYGDNGEDITLDIIHGGDGYDTIHIDTWGGTPRDGQFTITELVGTDGDASVTYQVKSTDTNEPEQDWILVLNEDGSGDAYYNYYDDASNTQNDYGTKFLSFTGIERVEFNDVEQTLERGSEFARWAGFDLTGDGVYSTDATDPSARVAHVADFGGSTYKLLYGEYLFDEAASIASALGGHILEIDSFAEEEFILREFLAWDSPIDRVMLGITDREYEGIWQTSDGRLAIYDGSYMGFDYNRQPDDWYNQEDFGELRFDNWQVDPGNLGGWNDRWDFQPLIVEIGAKSAGGHINFTSAADNTINAEDDALIGDASNQTLRGDESDNLIHGAGGDDELRGDAGNDVISGGAGSDEIYGEQDDDHLHGEDGDDILYGGSGDDYVKGDDGNDTISGDVGEDELIGGKGDDTINAADGEHDHINPGWGSDTVNGDEYDNIKYFVVGNSGPVDVDNFNTLDVSVENNGSQAAKITVDGVTLLEFSDQEGFVKLHDYSSSLVETENWWKDWAAAPAGQIDTISGVQNIRIEIRNYDWNHIGDLFLEIDYAGYGLNVEKREHTGEDLYYNLSDMGQVDIVVEDEMSADGYSPSNDNHNIDVDGTGASNTIDGRHVDGRQHIEGFDGDDTIYGGYGVDRIQGGNGNDIIYAHDDEGWGDSVEPGHGDDYIEGNETLWNEGGGTDLDYTGFDFSDEGIYFNMDDDGTGFAFTGSGNDPLTTDAANNPNYDTFKWIDYVEGTDDADKFYLPDTHQFGLQPRGGDDIIVGGAGAWSWVDYRGGDDSGNGVIVSMSDAAETVTTSELSTLSADLFIAANAANEGIVYDPWGGVDSLTNISSVRGTDNRDIFFGSGNDDHFVGHDGDDDFYGYSGDDIFAIGNHGDNYADGGDGYDIIRGNGFNVDIDKFSYLNTNIDPDTPVSSMEFYTWIGDLAAKIYFDTNGSLIHERRLQTDDPQYNVYDNVEELFWKYYEGDRRDDDDQIGEIQVVIDNANQTFTFSQKIFDDEPPTSPGLQNTPAADDFVGGWSWSMVNMKADGQTHGVTIDNSTGTVSDDGFGNVDTLSSVEGFYLTDFADTFSGGGKEPWNIDPSVIWLAQFESWLPHANIVDYEFVRGDGGDDTLDGGIGYDELGYGTSQTGLTIDLANSTQEDGVGGTDSISNFEGVEGTNFDDTIYGNDADNGLDGSIGNNTIDGRAGKDWAEYNDRGRSDLNVTLDASGNGTATYLHDGTTYTDTLISIEGIVGSNGDDTITGNDFDNMLLGWLGYDTIYGHGGGDHLASAGGGARLEGGSGNDTYYYAYNEVTTILDTAGERDTIIITTRDMDGNGYWSPNTYFEGADLVFEANGNHGSGGNELVIEQGSEIEFIKWRAADADTSNFGSLDGYDGSTDYTVRMFAHDDANLTTYLDGLTASDPWTMLVGTNSADTINVDFGTAGGEIYAADGEDEINISGSADTWISGGAGNDHIAGGSGEDKLYGNDGDDVLEGRGGQNNLHGGDGYDSAKYYFGTSITEDVSVSFDAASSQYNILSGANIIGSARFSGNDTLDVTINDLPFGNGLAEDTLLGMEVLHFAKEEAPEGSGYYNYTDYAINYADQTLTLIPQRNVISGTEGDDNLIGTDEADKFTALAGNDYIETGDGDDLVQAGDGDDTIALTGTGTAHIDGGQGSDLFILDLTNWTMADGTVIEINLEDGWSGLHNNPDEPLNDTLVSIEEIKFSGPYDGYLVGNGMMNYIHGGDGDDEIYGGGEMDDLHGGAGSDDLYGGDGNDDLRGNGGADDLYGGAGIDVYKSHEANWMGDTIHDYEVGETLYIQYDMDTNVAPDMDAISIVETNTAGTYKLLVSGTEYATLITKDTIGGLSFDKTVSSHGPNDHNGKFHYTIELTGTSSAVGVSVPTDSDGGANTVAEGSANGTEVGITAFSTDTSGTGGSITYSLSNDAGGRFAIDATSGIVTVANGALLDYETTTSHDITIVAQNTSGSTSSQTFTIQVEDVAEAVGPQPLRVEEVSRDGDTVTYGIFVNADQLANMYDGTDNDGTADVPGVQDIFTKLGYTETDFTSAGLTNFSVTTAGRNASDLEYVNAFWTGGATEGVTGSPQILQAYWDQSAAEGVWEAPWTGTDGEEYGISIDADVDFRDPWMTFEGTLAADVETVTFTLFETELDDAVASNSVSTFDYTSNLVSGTVVSRDYVDANNSANNVAGVVLDNTMVYAAASTAASTSEVFIRAVDLGETSTFEIVVRPTATASAVDVTLSGSVSIDNLQLGTMELDQKMDLVLQTNFYTEDQTPENWSVQSTDNGNNTFTISALDDTQSEMLMAGQEYVLATFDVTPGDQSPSLYFGSIAVDDRSQDDITVDLLAPTAVDANGYYEFEVENGVTVMVDADKDYAFDQNAIMIRSYDALQALQTALNKPGHLDSLDAMIAADITQDGAVRSFDALQTLQNALNKADVDYKSEWVFVDSDFLDQTLVEAGLTRENIDSPVAMVDTVTADLTLDLTGILLGDVDGSYADIVA